MVGRSGRLVSLTPGNWIGICLIITILIVAKWYWTTQITEQVGINTKGIEVLEKSMSRVEQKVDLIVGKLIPEHKQEPPDAKAQANALR